MPRLLLTGFEPFGGMTVNPSWEGVRPLDGEVWGRVVVRALRLPVSYARAPGALREAVEVFRPDAIAMFGVAQARRAVSIERRARNRSEGVADNDGTTAAGAIEAGAPGELGSTLPLDRIHAALGRAGVPVEWSDDAGGFLCNRVFWEALRRTGVPSGFVHVPPLEVLPVERLREAVRAVAEATMFERVPVAAAPFAPVPRDVAANADTMERLARAAAADGARLVLFPELATCGLALPSVSAARRVATPADGPLAARFAALSRDLGAALAWGFAEAAPGALHNSVLLVEPSGARHLYRKRRLYGHDFRWAVPGTAPGVFETALGRVAVIVCHDCVYADIAAESAGADLVLMPTNWIGDSGPGDCLRAFRAPVLAADRTGSEDGIDFADRSGLYGEGREPERGRVVDWVRCAPPRRVPG